MDIEEFNPNDWAKDYYLTDEILKSLDSTDDCDFIYTISVQSHGDYPKEKVLENPLISVYGLSDEGTTNSFTYYINQLYEVDQFIGDLVQALSERDEKTVLVLFGDHLPTLGLKDEDLDNIHSMYVDQWDWELVIDKKERTTETLQTIVKKIYEALRKTEEYVNREYPVFSKKLPENIFFITSQELEDRYPDLTAKQRENEICREYKAVFISQIGKTLNSGEKHDGRAPDYDDWELNGDILVWNPVLEQGFELSSMGVRVSEETLELQLKLANREERKELAFHKSLLAKELPYTVGGGIGQSRICMFFLEKLHIGEVQASCWPEEMVDSFAKIGAKFL
jgi:AsnA-type aspartate--ammonia ligase